MKYLAISMLILISVVSAQVESVYLKISTVSGIERTGVIVTSPDNTMTFSRKHILEPEGITPVLKDAGLEGIYAEILQDKAPKKKLKVNEYPWATGMGRNGENSNFFIKYLSRTQVPVLLNLEPAFSIGYLGLAGQSSDSTNSAHLNNIQNGWYVAMDLQKHFTAHPLDLSLYASAGLWQVEIPPTRAPLASVGAQISLGPLFVDWRYNIALIQSEAHLGDVIAVGYQASSGAKAVAAPIIGAALVLVMLIAILGAL